MIGHRVKQVLEAKKSKAEKPKKCRYCQMNATNAVKTNSGKMIALCEHHYEAWLDSVDFYKRKDR